MTLNWLPLPKRIGNCSKSWSNKWNHPSRTFGTSNGQRQGLETKDFDQLLCILLLMSHLIKGTSSGSH